MSSISLYTYSCPPDPVKNGTSYHCSIVPKAVRFMSNSLLEFFKIACRCFKNLALKVTPQKKSRGVGSGDLGGHSTARFNAITRFPNSSVKRWVTALLLWQGAPSCNHQRRWNLSFRFAVKPELYFFIDLSQVITAVNVLSKKNGSITVPFPIKRTHTVNLCRSSLRRYWKFKGCSPLGWYSRMFGVFTEAFNENPASSPMTTSSRN